MTVVEYQTDKAMTVRDELEDGYAEVVSAAKPDSWNLIGDAADTIVQSSLNKYKDDVVDHLDDQKLVADIVISLMGALDSSMKKADRNLSENGPR